MSEILLLPCLNTYIKMDEWTYKLGLDKNTYTATPQTLLNIQHSVH